MTTPPTSQISLMKVMSNQSKCWVFYDGADRLQKYEISVN